jgi:hypothetical protein
VIRPPVLDPADPGSSRAVLFDLALAHVDLTLARAAVILTRVGLPFACFDLTLPRVIARGRRPSHFRKP